MLAGLLRNIMENPKEAKFRRVRRSNGKFKVRKREKKFGKEGGKRGGGRLGGGGGTRFKHVHGRSLVTIDLHALTMPGRSTSGFR